VRGLGVSFNNEYYQLNIDMPIHDTKFFSF